jgi:Cell Wall Hydrolase
MAASRNRPEGGLRAPFGLGVLMLLLLPSEVGYQDLAARIARQQPVIERAQKAAFASPFGTIHETKLGIPQPIGTSIPPSLDYTLAALDPSDITGSIRLPGKDSTRAGPVVDRSGKGDYGVARNGDRVIALKGDRLEPAAPAQTAQDVTQDVARNVTRQDVARQDVARVRPDEAPPRRAERRAVAQRKNNKAPAAPPLSLAPPADAEPAVAEQPAQSGFSLASVGEPRAVAPKPSAYPVLAPPRDVDNGTEGEKSAEAEAGSESAVRSVTSLGFASADVDPALRAARVYFSIDPMGQKLGSLEPWAPGQEPKFEDDESSDVAVDPDSRPPAAKGDAGIKLAALPPEAFPPDQRERFVDAPVERADLPPLPALGVVRKNGVTGGQTVAPKGEVTGADKQPMTPAQRLHLDDEKSRAKSEKCLAEVIYFEARGEHVRGQMAVAQVVLNRAFSGKYPSTVCGVVYQNSHRHLACQFTFSCDGIPDVIREPDMWERAKTIAAEMLDGKLWLPEVGKATHYHAYWVRPGWVREMTKMHKLGVHTFYRPRAWGDGADAPEWGDAVATTESTKKLVEAAKKL